MGTPFIDVQDEFEGVDPFYVGNQDPNFYYAWINKKPENVERRKLEGYEIVNSLEGESALAPPDALKERRIGDVVLMRMPRERYERILRRNQERADKQLGSANEAAQEAINKLGFAVDETTKREVLRAGPDGEVV